jgi:GMP synthase-like glutamine amidotransferase
VPGDARRYAFIASLGAAQSVNDPDPPWIAAQVDLLRDAVSSAVPVLGLCWGGQALSVAMGGWVGPAARSQTGWLAVSSTDPDVPEGPWLHYHYETFTVPPGAVELARSPAGPAAFRAGRNLGLQFHPEATATMGEIWGHSDPNRSRAGVQALASEGARLEGAARTQAFALFDAWYRTV